MKKTRKDLISGSFLFVLGLFLSIHSTDFRIWSRSGPGAGFFPLILGFVIILLSLTLLAQFFFSKKDMEVRKEAKKETAGTKPSPAKVYFYAFSILAYGLLMRRAGFLVMTLLFLLLVLKYVEKQTWKNTLFVSITTTVISYLLFEYWLGVPLPMGFMKDLLP